MSVLTTCLGYPRIGPARELKRALESFWAGSMGPERLLATARELRRARFATLRRLGVDHIPSNDFSLYDHVLDMAVTLGAVPDRYRALEDPLTRYFAMARGYRDPTEGRDLPALEMTKWFDTNYHYIVPELDARTSFNLDATKILGEVREARAMGLETRPVLLGPVSFCLLSKPALREDTGASTLDVLEALLPVYVELLRVLSRERVEWVQLDEPCLVLDLDARARSAYQEALPLLARAQERPKILLATYFEALAENLALASGPAFEALHVDLVRAPGQLGDVLAVLPESTTLSLGVVDGRNVWRTDLDRAHTLVRKAVRALGPERVWVAPSCSLLHVPLDLAQEHAFDPELQSWLAFAVQKLMEIRAIADAAESEVPGSPEFSRARRAIASHRSSPRTQNGLIRTRVANLNESMLTRSAPYPERSLAQRARFKLPVFPTTTIGSFPQTSEVRKARARARAGKLSREEYAAFLRDQIERSVEKQERIGLDVLVHGEFERSDMVEFFAERLEGFALTENGWVQSYGSRSVKPPILYGDVDRPRALSVEWTEFAQSLTSKPMKAMLTGPVTLLEWSFVRDDQPRRETCLQLALALRDEVEELEASGIGMIQVDEPAFREGLPLRRAKRPKYLAFAVECFRLATSGVSNQTQIQTHMCYSDFHDVLDAIRDLDADVLYIENARSGGTLLEDFRAFPYPNELGPGVYDIHSPRVPKVSEVLDLIKRAQAVVPRERLWVNPDCGLKTRDWSEVDASLAVMVEAARRARAEALRAKTGT